MDDSQACELTQDSVSPLLKSVALCGFTHMEQTLPILDLGKLCSDEFREIALDSQDLVTQGLLVEELVQVESGRTPQ